MVFNSIPFIFFFVAVCLLMALTNLPAIKKLCGGKLLLVRHIILLIASYIFYGWWDYRFAFLMLALSAVAHFCSLQAEKSKSKLPLYIAVIVPLVILGIFKYFNFFIDSFTAVFGITSNTINIILPVGISFYTFQSLSYTIDVYNEKIPAERSFIKTALYISFFPQLVAGPIVKAGDFIPQLYQDRTIGLKNMEKGLQFFLFGLFKKIVLADNISVCVDAVFANPEAYHAVSILFAVIGYSIQIYCDFSGYSDMAIGCAKCMGYDLEKNFNMPYISRSVGEFWKRWHISLSTWLMEYLYIPLGGNRKGTVRTYINLLLTMLLGGLWHGAAWTFVVWGALHGTALCVHKLWQKLTRHGKNHKGTIPGNILSVLITYAFVLLCWVFFRASDFSTAKAVIAGIVTWQNGIFYISSWTVLGIILMVACTGIAMLRSARQGMRPTGYYPMVKLTTIPGLVIYFVVLGLALGLAYTGNNPFIYFQF